jgi:DNA-directed RNA polymerase subunit delta
MKPKSDKENEFPEKKPAANFSKTSLKKKGKGASSKKTCKSVNDDVVVEIEIEDDWGKADDDEDYDPDFEEFDFPKSKIKKSSVKKGESGEDLDMDEYLKRPDLFNDGTEADDDEDDF